MAYLHHLLCSQSSNGGLISYSTVLVSCLGFNSNQSILLQIPSGAFNVIFRCYRCIY